MREESEGEEEEEEEEEVEKATRRESQPYLPPPEVVTARAERVVWQRSLPRDFEFSPGLEEDEPVEFEDLRESDDVEVVEVDGDEEEEEEETSGELGSWDHDLQEQYIRWKYGKHKKSRMTDEKYSIEENVDNLKFSSEGASFESPRDISMKEGDVLAFGEDYGDFLR